MRATNYAKVGNPNELMAPVVSLPSFSRVRLVMIAMAAAAAATATRTTTAAVLYVRRLAKKGRVCELARRDASVWKR